MSVVRKDVVSSRYERKEMPSADCEARSLSIWGSLTMEEPATVAMPRVLERRSVRQVGESGFRSRMRVL